MIILDNLFGEFLDGALGMSALEAKEAGATYILIGEHTIGFWILVAAVLTFTVAVCVSKKFRRKFF